ncbi:protein SHORTAGE IN CHIASMATA 1-like [Neltuma alba]|uniref:protein SHORTAGE IN CHIASMATA 1-like n=1 Tax=Neltuma alba TaxID=207710 RepID=UPI0010A3DDEE|nr:protein SHORTAGE IN CHIASMATA 1-like [Prosopis alba]
MSQLGGRTPLSRALHSTTPLKNSPWTIEFINRIKEKSRIRQKVLSCDKSVSCFGYSGSTSEVATRRHPPPPPPPPPPPESFAYQGSRTENAPKQKRQKQCAEPLKSAKNRKHSASLLPTWTPNDKRATKMLTFAMNESQGQAKLVWNDETQGQAKKFRYQTQKSI